MQAAERQTVCGTPEIAKQAKMCHQSPCLPLGLLATFPAVASDGFRGHRGTMEAYSTD